MHDPTASLDRRAEARLVERAKTNDPAALRELIDSHKDRLFGFIFRMVRDHHEAEDICQDAFLKAFASLHTFSSEYRFSTWLFTIGYRVCLNRLRRRRPSGVDAELASVPVLDTPSDALESEEAHRLRNTVWSAVDQLSPPQKATVLLFYRHGLGCQEVARVVQLPLATVKSHLHRARARLRELLEPLHAADWCEVRNRVSRTG